MPYRTFIVPRIFYGPGALESLTTIPAKRVLLVTDPGIRTLGLAERVVKILRSNGSEVAVFDQVEANPSKDTVLKVLAQANDFRPDIFLGLGGGSSMDTAKAAWAFYEHPDLATMPLYDFRREVPKRALRNKARLVAIPTTSGTGSEATGATVVTDLRAKPIPEKVGIISPQLVPDFAIVDPELTISMPASITADTGFDALIHAIECWVLYAPPVDIIDDLGIGASRTIWEWLPRAVADGKDMAARAKMHLAATQAGIAFGNGRVGTVHVFSHELSAVFGIPHGRANALMLCPVFAFLYPTHHARLASLAESLGFTGRGDRGKVERLLAGLDELRQRVGIPMSIKETGLSQSHFKAHLRGLAESYMIALEQRAPGRTSAQRQADGWPVSIAEAEALLMHAWNGTRAELK